MNNVAAKIILHFHTEYLTEKNQKEKIHQTVIPSGPRKSVCDQERENGWKLEKLNLKNAYFTCFFSSRQAMLVEEDKIYASKAQK